MAGEISQYGTEFSETGSSDRLDVSRETSPGVWETGWVRGDRLLPSENLYCVVRHLSSATEWEFINDSSHEPSANIQSITTNPATGYNFSIQHNSGFTKIGSVVAGVDESYASYGLRIGASVGLTESFFRVTRDGFGIRALVSGGNLVFASDVGQLVLDTDFSYTFDPATGTMVVSHPDIVCTYGDSVILLPYQGTSLEYRVVSKNSTSITFKMYDNGVLVTALSSSIKFYLTRTGTFQCTNEQIKRNSANFWIKGIFKK